MKSLIIGYGNPYRRDDGFGWRVIETLKTEPVLDTEFIETLQLMPEMAEDISHVSKVVFVDASVEGIPGEVHVEKLHVEHRPPLNYTHYVAPQELLMMAELLYGHKPEACLITVTGQDFDLGEGLTAGVEQAVPEVVEVIRGVIAEG
ncbi:MAG TPA: hydrogenase maturation protease [Anaerolineales bacterium]|nr:hydrogenase maturation protease [Anaerolineales bacterium]